MASDDQPKPGESITLDSLQHDILIPQIQAFLDATNDPQAREVYQTLKTAIESLEVPADLQLRLGAIVEVALTSGRVRRLFGPGAELSLNALFLKTPRGREVAKSLAELNKALATLKGQVDRADHINAKKPRRLRPNNKDRQLPNSNPLRTIRRKSREPRGRPSPLATRVAFLIRILPRPLFHGRGGRPQRGRPVRVLRIQLQVCNLTALNL